MRKKNQQNENYLERIPCHPSFFKWDADESGLVTFYIENKGFFKWVTQILLKKPRVSQIHLDKTGSFIWQTIDGEKNLVKIGEELEEKFGDEAKPVYERLTKFFCMLDGYKFIEWKE